MMLTISRRTLAHVFGLIVLSQWPTLSNAQDSLGSDVQEFDNPEDATLDGSLSQDGSDASAQAPADAAGESSAESSPSQNSSAETTEKIGDQAQPTPESSQEPEQAQPDSATAAEGESKTQTQSAEAPSTDQPSAESVAVSEPESTEKETPVTGTYGGRIFGRNKIQLAANRPTFNEGQKCYNKFYGKPQTHISFSGEWFPLDWWVNPGIYTRLGVYSVRGKAVSGTAAATQSASCDTLSVDENSSTNLLFVPIQLGAKLQFSPFRRKWLVVDYWTGAELDWWQETRSDSALGLSPIGLVSASQVYTTTGRKRAISAGASVHLLLNPLDERTVRSMIETMGIGYVYLSGFVETVKATSKEGLNFGRNVVGLGFTFEAFK
jgi:hypothetical protein